MDFSYLFKALLRRKWIILGCFVVALGLAFFLTQGLKRQYKSTAQMSTGFTVSEEIRLSDERFNMTEIDVKFNNVIENINSSKVRSLVSYRAMLHDLESPQPFRTLDEEARKKPLVKAFNKADAARILHNKLDSVHMLSPAIQQEKDLLSMIEYYEYGLASLNEMLQVARFQRTDYINVVSITENPYLSSFLVNTVCEEFRRFYGLDKRTRSDVSVVTLDSIATAKKQILDDKVLMKNQYMASQGVVDVNLEGSNKLGQISNFESQLIQEKAMKQNLSYRIGELNNLIAEARKGKAGVGTSSTGSNQFAEYVVLKRQYDELYNDYIRGGRSDASLKLKLDNLSKRMNAMDVANEQASPENATQSVTVDDLVQKRLDAEGELRSTNQKIASIESKLMQLNGGFSGMAATGASIKQLDKEIEMAAAEYSEAKDKLNLALNIGDNIEGNFKQTISGDPALKPEPSKRMAILAMSGVCALLLSSISIVGIEFFDSSIKTPTNFQRLTKLPLLGVVTMVDLKHFSILDRITHFEAADKSNRENSFRELLRKMRYELEASGKKIFLFTSTEPQQGKTTLTQAIAYSLSLGKKRVLIIDTNFCNNDLTKAINATPVLEKIDFDKENFDFQSLSKLITKSKIEGVDIIGCEGGDYTPAEILPKSHLLNYLDILKKEYDFIFLEAAPLNGFTDTKELIKYVEGMIAVFSATTTLTAADKESINFLTNNSDKFIGAILNKVEDKNLTV